MAWVRIDDQAPRNQKMLDAGPAACWLWVCGIAHCQSQLTDGFISDKALPMIGVIGVTKTRQLADVLVQAGLFEQAEGGYRVHDYLDHNPSRTEVLAKRAEDTKRKRAAESGRNPLGIQTESGAPRARVPSHPIPSHPKASPSEREHVHSLEPEEFAERAGRLVERYGELYLEHRHGAKHRQRPNLDWQDACQLVKLWDDKRLEKLAVLVLTTDDDWISKTDRSFKIFSVKATWADDRLKAWEREHGMAV